MQDILNDVYEKISIAKSLDEYQLAVNECTEYLEKEGMGEIADKILALSAVQINRFSKQSTQDNFEYSKNKVLACLNKEKNITHKFSENEAVKIILSIMEHFHDYCRCLYKDDIHGRCSDSLKRNLPYLAVKNEYDLQRFMYAIIRALFPDGRVEETEDSGHHMIRKDIVIDSCDMVIELKCTNEKISERRLSEEIASDIIHYGNKYIFFYIYDKENVVKNALDFQKTYESKNVEGKKVFVRVWQSNDISSAQDFALAAKSVPICRCGKESGSFAVGKTQKKFR